MTLDQLNHLDHAAFVATLGGIFEHSPWVAERVVAQRPFAGVSALHDAMCAEVDAASAAMLEAPAEPAAKSRKKSRRDTT